MSFAWRVLALKVSGVIAELAHLSFHPQTPTLELGSGLAEQAGRLKVQAAGLLDLKLVLGEAWDVFPLGRVADARQ
jgi:hypothetical protein